MMRSPITRRQFLQTTAAALGSLALPSVASALAGDNRLGFFLIGDTHYFAAKENPTEIDADSAEVTARLINQLNKLPGTAIPAAAGGGTVRPPRGLIHAGDLIDSGDKGAGPVAVKAQETEWQGYIADFGLTGNDGRLKCPVYEVHGNHDSPGGDGPAIRAIIERNKRRPGLKHISANGLHYSWDWGRVHFVNVGIVVGSVPDLQRKRRYNPLASLAFLADDLKQNVGDSHRPVIITHHIDVHRYTGACDAAAPFASKEWDSCDVRGFYDTLQPYNVIAICYGHTHARNILQWDGQTTAGVTTGLNIFNVDNASHYKSDTQGVFYMEITDNELLVREFTTKDRWATGAWTPQVWRRPIHM